MMGVEVPPHCRTLILGSLCLLVLSWNIGLTEGTHHCLECLDGEPAEFCNASSNLRQCSGDKEVCITTITNQEGSLLASKGCLLTELCQMAATRNDDFCDDGVVLRQCTYCCTGDSCNYDRFVYSASIPTTSTSPATTAATTLPDIISTVTPDTCGNENLTKCTNDYEEAIMVAMKNPRTNFPYFCRQVPVMFTCIAEALSSCCKDNQLELHHQLSVMSHTMWSQCPRECDSDQGQLCVSGTVQKVIIDVIAGNTTCEKLRKQVIVQQKCLVIRVGTCGSAVTLGFEVTAKVIKEAVEVICTSPEPTSPPAGTQAPSDVTTELVPVTEGPGCKPDVVENCLILLASNLTLSDDPDYDLICNSVLPATEKCYKDNSHSCSTPVMERLERAFNFTRNLMTKDCTTTTEAPPTCDTAAARACALKIWTIIDTVGDFGLACGMKEETVECVLSNVTGCTQREKVSLNNTLELILQRLDGQCEQMVEMEGNCSNVVLEEGGNEETISFFSNFDPKVLCGGEKNCEIYVEVVVEEKQFPKCRNGDTIPQISCRPEAKPTSGLPCAVRITSDNWKKTHRIHLAASLDKKVDGKQTREMRLVYKKIIDGEVSEVKTVETCLITIIDHDTTGQCQSLNDPHIKTFDGVLYDNFYEGVFVLYRHTELPYEVQAFYQKCGPRSHATCNCGVAVKSGDYVFVAELCRRKRKCGKRRRCKNLLKARSFVWDEVTPGTRLFKRPSGFDIMLPHGTVIMIKHFKSLGLIDVMINPSSADFKKTTGLCGMYDGQRRKDLLLPNGNPYTGRNIGQHKQPKDFCRSWRVKDRTQYLSEGAPYNPFYPKEYCLCADKDCGQVSCHASNLVSTCDLNTEGEIHFDNLPMIRNGEEDDQKTRQKRAIEDGDDMDFDLDYEPETIDPSTRRWAETEAQTFCQAFIDGSDLANLCQYQAGVEVQHYTNICVQDIMLADDTKYAISALEGLKADCVNVVSTDPKFTSSDTDKHIVVKINEANCPMECSKHGTCDKGKCHCGDGFVGESCEVRSDAVPSYLSTDFDGLCSTRKTDCSNIIVYADDIIDSDSLTCHLNTIKITEQGITNSSDHQKLKAVYFSSNQVLCRVDRNILSGGFYVDLSNDGLRTSGQKLLYVSHDPHCYTCQITDSSATCSRKANTCVVDGVCYVQGETPPNDACSVCDPGSSLSTLKKEKSIACLGPFVTIMIVAALILVVIVFGLIVMYCCCRKCQGNKTTRRTKMEEGVSNELMYRYKS